MFDIYTDTARKDRDAEIARRRRLQVAAEIAIGDRKPCCGRGWSEACPCEDLGWQCETCGAHDACGCEDF